MSAPNKWSQFCASASKQFHYERYDTTATTKRLKQQCQQRALNFDLFLECKICICS